MAIGSMPSVGVIRKSKAVCSGAFTA